jgi:hypothetical protein
MGRMRRGAHPRRRADRCLGMSPTLRPRGRRRGERRPGRAPPGRIGRWVSKPPGWGVPPPC